MALLFMDGCDHVSALADLAGKWDETSAFVISTTGGRFGGGAYSATSSGRYLVKAMPSQKGTVIAGWAVKIVTLDNTNQTLFMMRNSADGSHMQLQVKANSGHLLVLDATGALIGTSTQNLAIGYWYHIEVKTVCHDTTGSVEVRVNEDVWLNLTNEDTKNGGDNIDDLRWQSPDTSSDHMLDDFYIMDDTGSANNDFAGDSRIWTLNPNAAGNNARFTADSGNNWERVDEAFPPDGDTSYVESDSNGYKDLYEFADLPETIAIDAMQAAVFAKKDSAPSREMALCMRSGVTCYSGASQVLTTAYQYFMEMYENDPDTGVAWVQSGLDAAQLGQEISL